MSSQKQHVFSQVPKATIPRSSFDRSFNHKTVCDAGILYPVYCDEVLPGDTVNLRAALFGRLATPLKPTLDNIYCETFFFFVPTRLVWENWEKFMGAQDNPGDSTDYVIPRLSGSSADMGHNTIYDYFGLPVPIAPNAEEINVLPFRAYNLIWNEWFRDQNLQDSVALNKGDGPDNANTFTLLRRGKRHDYFTSCLPWPQKSETEVGLDLGGLAPITHTGNVGDQVRIGEEGGTFRGLLSNDGANQPITIGGSATGETNLFADLSGATGFTINQLRQSFAIQKLFERDARGGTRYVESIKAHFGVTSPDFRHQRPEFLGSGHTPVQVNPVAQTVPDDIGPDQGPLGNLGAFGVVADSGHGFTKSFTEHGYIIGLVNFRADLSYQRGIRRMWSRKTRFDFFYPALSHLGEMPVLNKEIYYDNSDTDSNQEVFGYQEAWGDYRYAPSMITSKMRSQNPGSLDVWHLAQEFANRPTLSAQFIEDNPPIDRIIAVQDEPHFLLDIYFKQRWARPMPLYGVPGLIDHF